MKRRIALLVSATAVLVVAARPVAALPAAPAPAAPAPGTQAATALPADAVGLSISQVVGNGLAVTLDAGASEEHDLVVSNHTQDLRLTVKLTATDAVGNLGAGAAAWLGFADDVVQIDPHGATTVPMTVAVPHDTQPGPVLVHVVATVESAVSAADGSPRSGTANVTFPVAITVSGAATAQIAVADVHRVDQGSTHDLAIVLRNFGNQGAHVSGHVRVGGDHPQTLQFDADLAASRDTTLDLPWNATTPGTPTDIAVDVEYGSGNVAAWSSTLGAPPTTIDSSPATGTTPATGTANASGDNNNTNASSAPVSAGRPWWQGAALPVIVIVALVLAAIWFVFELRGSKRREREMPFSPFVMAPPGWSPGSNDALAELARRLVELTEIIVRLATNTDGASGAPAPPARARSPGAEADGRGPPEADRSPPDVFPTRDLARSASTTPGAEARPETAPAPDPREVIMRRLLDLDQERQRVRAWMDDEDRAAAAWPEGEPRLEATETADPAPDA